jgi:hypothetical protein
MRKLFLFFTLLAVFPVSVAAQSPGDEDCWPVLGRDYDGDQTTVTETIHGFPYLEWFHCDFFEGNLAYNIISKEDRTVEVTNLHTAETSGDNWIYVADTIRVPETVEHNDTVYTVRAIGLGAFSGSYVHHVVIPSTVTDIGLKAFSYVYGMGELSIPSSVKTIGDYAFSGQADTGKYCPAKVVFADDTKVESWGEFVFAHRRDKESPTLPDYLTTVPYGIYCDNGMTEWPELSDNIEVISASAYSENDFESISLPKNLKEIGNQAFYKCKNLKSVTIPPSVTSFGDKVFGSSNTQCFLDTLRFLPTTPPVCQAKWEEGPYKYTNAIIIVPNGTKDLYKTAWSLSLISIFEENEVTAIEDLRMDDLAEKAYYSLDGRRLKSPQKGINIIRRGDGTVRKEIVR